MSRAIEAIKPKRSPEAIRTTQEEPRTNNIAPSPESTTSPLSESVIRLGSIDIVSFVPTKDATDPPKKTTACKATKDTGTCCKPRDNSRRVTCPTYSCHAPTSRPCKG